MARKVCETTPDLKGYPRQHSCIPIHRLPRLQWPMLPAYLQLVEPEIKVLKARGVRAANPFRDFCLCLGSFG